MNSWVLCISGLHNSILTSGCFSPRIWDSSAGFWKGKLLAEGLKRINYHHAKEEIFVFPSLICDLVAETSSRLQVKSPTPERSDLFCPCCSGLERNSHGFQTRLQITEKTLLNRIMISTPELHFEHLTHPVLWQKDTSLASNSSVFGNYTHTMNMLNYKPWLSWSCYSNSKYIVCNILQ